MARTFDGHGLFDWRTCKTSILPYDTDNLRKVLGRTAKPSARLLDRLEQAKGQEASE